MSTDEQRNKVAYLLLERLELKRDIAGIKNDLSRRADAVVKVGGLLRSNPHVIGIDDQNITGDYVQRVQKFNSEDLDPKRIAVLVDELRSKTDQLNTAEKQIKEMGYALE